MPNKWSNLDPREFEWLCALALKRQGYKKIQLTPKAQDEGIDIIASYLNKTWGVEVKQRSQGSIGRPIIQQLYGATQSEGRRAMVMTNTKFTSAAEEFALKSNIVLVSGKILQRWVKDADVKRACQCAKKEKVTNISLEDSSFLDDILQNIFGSAKKATVKIIKAPVTVPKKTAKSIGGIVSTLSPFSSSRSGKKKERRK